MSCTSVQLLHLHIHTKRPNIIVAFVGFIALSINQSVYVTSTYLIQQGVDGWNKKRRIC